MNRPAIFASVIGISALIAGCSSTGSGGAPMDMDNLPERAAYTECLMSRAALFAEAEGDAIDLGKIVTAGCREQRKALAIALSNGSAGFVSSFMGNDSATQLLAAEMIVRVRTQRARG